MQGGDGSGNNSSIIPGGGNDLSRCMARCAAQVGHQHQPAQHRRSARAARGASASSCFAVKIDAMIAGNPKLSEYRSQIRIDVTPDGLQIQIVDDQSRPMFDSGSALVKHICATYCARSVPALGAWRTASAWPAIPTPRLWQWRPGLQQLGLSADRANASLQSWYAAGTARRQAGPRWSAWRSCWSRTARAAMDRRITITVLTHRPRSSMLGRKPQ